MAAALALAGCATQKSKNVRTGGISPSMTVEADADGVTVSVRLGAGGVNTVELDDGDTLTASAGGHTIDLKGGTFLGVAGYGGHIGGVNSPGTTVTVALRRPSRDTSALHSTVVLPVPVSVGSPARGATVSRSRDLDIRADDAPGAIRLGWHGSCVDPLSTLGDIRRGDPVVLPAGSIQPAAPTGKTAAPTTCLMTLTVARVAQGKVDAAFDGGDLVAVRTTSVLVRSVP